MKLLLDEMYSPAIAVELRARGHDVVSVHDSGHPWGAGASDAEVFAGAQAEGSVLVTENVRDYRSFEASLVAGSSHHAGLVYSSNRQFPRGDPATVGRIVHALEALLSEGQDLRDRSIFLSRAAD